MPSSSPRGKIWTGDKIAHILSRTTITNVLDLGAGEGTYSDRFRKLTPGAQWTGVEIWPDYITQFGLATKYDTVVQGDIRTLEYSSLGRADLVFAGDVLEHVTKEEAMAAVDQILEHNRCLIISIPVVHMPQGEYMGNPHEVHVKDDWSDDEVKLTFGAKIIDSTVDKEIGVYILSTDRDFIQRYRRLKIAVYTICKNEAAHVERWALSNQEADLRIVCDTGSTDDTVKLLESHGVTVYPITVSPWRFDVARNTALNLVPIDVDICIWQDLDEALLPGWRTELEKNWNSETTIANHRYRHNGNAWQWHSKIHARQGCWWTGAVHETLKWNKPEQAIWLPEFYLDERQDTAKSRRNYIDLLHKKIFEGDNDWRTYYFLSNEQATAGLKEEGVRSRIVSYEKCNDGPAVKSYIARNIAVNYQNLEDTDAARRWFHIAVSDSDEREAWFKFCEFSYNYKDWEQCYLAAKRCMEVKVRRDGFTYDPAAWGYLVFDYAAIAAHRLGLKKQAIMYGEQALSMNPEDSRLASNLKFYREEQ